MSIKKILLVALVELLAFSMFLLLMVLIVSQQGESKNLVARMALEQVREPGDPVLRWVNQRASRLWGWLATSEGRLVRARAEHDVDLDEKDGPSCQLEQPLCQNFGQLANGGQPALTTAAVLTSGGENSGRYAFRVQETSAPLPTVADLEMKISNRGTDKRRLSETKKGYFISVGCFERRNNADILQARVKGAGMPVYQKAVQSAAERSLSCVISGPITTHKMAKRAMGKMQGRVSAEPLEIWRYPYENKEKNLNRRSWCAEDRPKSVKRLRSRPDQASSQDYRETFLLRADAVL